MIYDHVIKFNGMYYPSGTEVPTEDKAIETTSDTQIKEENTAPVKRGRPKRS